MKTKAIIILAFTGVLLLSIINCSKGNSLKDQLDDLEKIIVKYEPEFESIEYGSKEYSEMIIEYNKEIFAWAEIFENDRYKRDEKGTILIDSLNKPVMIDEFKDVEQRFYDLNNRMTRMVLAKIPKPERPQSDTEPAAKQPN